MIRYVHRYVSYNLGNNAICRLGIVLYTIHGMIMCECVHVQREPTMSTNEERQKQFEELLNTIAEVFL